MKFAISKLTGIALASVLGVTILLAVSVGALVGTEKGTSWLLQKSALWTKGALTLGAHRGNLADGLSINSITWRQERLTVDLDMVEVEVSWLDLLNGALTVDSLVAGNVAIHWRSAASSSTSLPALPQPFLPITVRRLAVKNVRWRSGDSAPITIDAIAFAARWDTEGLAIRRLAAKNVQWRSGDSAPIIIDAIAFAARWDTQGLAIRSVEVESPFGGLNGGVHIDGRAPHDLSGHLRVHALLPELPDLKAEFAGVSRTYIPMHAVVRIDVVEKSGQSKVTEVTAGGDKVMPFPVFTPGPGNPRS